MALKNAYRKGYRNEKKSREFLEQQGYWVTEARGSHGLFDLVGIPTDSALGLPVLVQSKTNTRPSKADIMAMRGLKVVAQKVVHVWHDRQAEPEVLEVK